MILMFKWKLTIFHNHQRIHSQQQNPVPATKFGILLFKAQQTRQLTILLQMEQTLHATDVTQCLDSDHQQRHGSVLKQITKVMKIRKPHLVMITHFVTRQQLLNRPNNSTSYKMILKQPTEMEQFLLKV
jgi:hypothetical protein